MFSVLTAAAFLLLGAAVLFSRAFHDEQNPLFPMERATYAAMAGLSMWIASSWVLALTKTFTRPALVVRLVLAAAIAIALAFRSREQWISALRRRTGSPYAGAIALAFLPMFLWVVFIVWRGGIVPPVSHDALSYHLPKATLIVRAAGYEHFEFLHAAIRSTPINYELMLAEVIAWTGSDAQTEWLSAMFYVLVALAAGALAERFWRSSGAPAAIAAVAMAGIPVVLLHSGAHKNDLMVAFFMVAAGVASGRWLTTGRLQAFVLLAAAFGAAIGTKPQAAALAVFMTPFVLIRAAGAARDRSLRLIVLLVLVSIVAFLLLGGVVFLGNVVHEGALLDAKQTATERIEIVPYGDWKNLWQGPYVLVAAPFSRSPIALSVPWSSEPWFWRRYELYFSHLGVIFSICAITAPLALILLLRRGTRQERYERVAVTAAFLAAFALMLPVGFKPHGLYAISLPRYALFLVPVVFAWTLVPFVSAIERKTRRASVAVVAVLALTFAVYAIDFGENDAFAPLEYVLWARGMPGTRTVAFDANRAASMVDRRAGPRDRVALDAGFGTWIQPAFGTSLQRPVVFIPPGEGPPLIADDVRWVAVDRAYQIVWGHPNFRDLSEARRYLLRGRPTEDDLRVIDHLRARDDFELVFYNQRMLQAVFRRRPGGIRD